MTNKKLKKIREFFYKISPAYKAIKKLSGTNQLQVEKLDEILQEVRIIKNANNDSLTNYLDEVFEASNYNPNLNAKLGQKIITKGQSDIILNVMNYIVRDKKFLIIDIGASDAWFFRILLTNKSIANVSVFAYEPLKIYSDILADFKKSHSNFDYKQIGIGDSNTTLKIKENGGLLGLSSFMEISEKYQYFKGSIDQSVKQEYEVPVKTLDSEFENNSAFNQFDNILLKIDVQGFEAKVLKGAEHLFDSGKVKAVLIEITTIEKYRDSAGYSQIFDFFHKKNYILFDLLPFYRENDFKFQPTHTGRLTEFDAVFVHNLFIETLN